MSSSSSANSSRSVFALVAASLLSSASAQCGTALGVGALNNCKFFKFDSDAEFVCGSSGSRCGFQRNDYDIDPVANGGTFVDQTAGTVWTSSRGLSDTLEIGSCKDGECVIYCYADCTCTDLTTGSDCETTTPMPTPSPVETPAPTPYNCPQKKGREHCHKLMTEHFPTTDPGCDCYNFCNGEFQSCCQSLSGLCGSTECVVDDGSINSAVLGCTKEDKKDPSGGGGGGGGSTGSVPPPTVMGAVVAGVGAAAALAL